MKARYQYRFYPTDQQRQSLAQLFGCVRVVWNDALAICKQADKLPGYNKLSALLTQSKKNEDREWLKCVSSVPLQQSIRNLDVAYRNFFNSRNGKRKGGKIGSPNFKKRSRELPSEPSSVTVIKDCANRYFLSFVVEIQPVQLNAKSQSIGIDLGIKTFAVMSNGEKAYSPTYRTIDCKIRKLQKKLARQQKGSNRRNITRLRIARLHNQIADLRKDFLHKLSTKIVSENQTIVLEDLNVSGMVKNRKLSRAISQQGWREFRTLCEAKSEKFDRNFQVISRWEPTSQICSGCGFRWGKVDLSIRSILCLNCGVEQDRDENASRNIEMVGIGHCHDLKRAGSDSKTTSVANCCERRRITVASAR
jgi:putative transposase